MAGKVLVEATLVAVAYSTMDVQLWRLKNIQTDLAASEGSSPAFLINPQLIFLWFVWRARSCVLPGTPFDEDTYSI